MLMHALLGKRKPAKPVLPAVPPVRVAAVRLLSSTAMGNVLLDTLHLRYTKSTELDVLLHRALRVPGVDIARVHDTEYTLSSYGDLNHRSVWST